MPELSIEERLRRLEALQRIDDEQAPHDLRNKAKNLATQDALVQFAQEVGQRLGYDKELLSSRLRAAARWYFDRYLRIAERIDQTKAAQIDDRDPADVSTDEAPPPILPPP